MPLVLAFGALLALGLVLFAGLSIWLRGRERRRLGEQWAEGRGGTDRDAFIRAGLESYDRSPRRRVLLALIVLPLGGFALLLYLLNVS